MGNEGHLDFRRDCDGFGEGFNRSMNSRRTRIRHYYVRSKLEKAQHTETESIQPQRSDNSPRSSVPSSPK